MHDRGNRQLRWLSHVTDNAIPTFSKSLTQEDLTK